VEGSGFCARYVEELGPQSVKNSVPKFVACYVRTFARKDIQVLDYLMEEIQASVSRVESIEINPSD